MVQANDLVKGIENKPFKISWPSYRNDKVNFLKFMMDMYIVTFTKTGSVFISHNMHVKI
jgi:hypothetical protein